MHVVIVRHGQAMSSQDDPLKPLSQHGQEQARQVGRQLKSLGITVDRIHHSPKARALGTAQLIAQEMGTDAALHEHTGIRPNDPVEPVAREILDGDESVMLVSHLPFVGYLTAVLMDHSTSELPQFSTACCAVISRAEDNGRWTLTHFLSPEG